MTSATVNTASLSVKPRTSFDLANMPILSNVPPINPSSEHATLLSRAISTSLEEMSRDSPSSPEIRNRVSKTPTNHHLDKGNASCSNSFLLTSLPESLLFHILDHLCFIEEIRFLSCNGGFLWKTIRASREEHRRSLVLNPDWYRRRTTPPQVVPGDNGQWQVSRCGEQWEAIYGRWKEANSRFSFAGTFCWCANLLHLDLQHYCTRHFLETTKIHGFFPKLQRISMRRSNMKDSDLAILPQCAFAETLEYVDITFTLFTTYGGTVCLRDDGVLPNLKVLRRQPEWLDGKFHTPFASDSGSPPEIHTYWPDGTFSFTRASQCRGFVCGVQDLTLDSCFLRSSQLYTDVVSNKIQYNVLDETLGWGAGIRHIYRPSVCLFNLVDEDSDNPEHHDTLGGKRKAKFRTILAAQSELGLRPPVRFRTMIEQVVNQVPEGSSKLFSSAGVQLGEDDDRESTGDAILVSKMRVEPLDNLVPPKDLVEACRQTCEERKQFGECWLAAMEEQLHAHMTGR